jgi:hypothetical protein
MEMAAVLEWLGEETFASLSAAEQAELRRLLARVRENLASAVQRQVWCLPQGDQVGGATR